MTFADYFKSSIYPEWRFYYVDYERLRGLIRDKTAQEAGGLYEETDEARFIEELESEMQKVT